MAKHKLLSEFRAFIERGSAIDMAVGIIVGSVMTGLVNSLVSDILMPPIGALIGNVDFSQFFIVLSGGTPGAHYNTIAEAQAAGAATMNVGNFLNSVVSFLITMFAIFLLVRSINKVRSKKVFLGTRYCPYCKSSISVAATKCPNCCSKVKPEKSVVVDDRTVNLRSDIKKITKVASKKISKITDSL